MSKAPKFITIIVSISAVGWGQTQIATVSSPSAFTLRGAPVNPGLGVPSWPVLTGDSIKAGSSPVTLTFADGSTITLNPGAEATVDLSGQTPVFRLTKGSASYNLKTLASVKIMSGNQNFTVSALTGTLSKAGSRTALAMVGAGAAAGLGVGVSQATRGGSSVSPSH